jgi:hypothetical protein
MCTFNSSFHKFILKIIPFPIDLILFKYQHYEIHVPIWLIGQYLLARTFLTPDFTSRSFMAFENLASAEMILDLQCHCVQIKPGKLKIS